MTNTKTNANDDRLFALMRHQPEGSPIARLMAAYPHLFQNGAPDWSDLPEGWYGIATDFLDLVHRHLGDGLANYFRIEQCKEKLAELRMYWSLHGRKDLHVDIHLGNGQVKHLILPAAPVVDKSPFDDDGNEIDADGFGDGTGSSTPRLHPVVAEALERARVAIRAEEQAILGRSRLTCQTCGAPGRGRAYAWMRTLCDVCAVSYEQSTGDREITMAERHRGVHPGGRVDSQDS